MPRRRALTQAQLDELFALPAAEPDLIRHWTLSAADLAAIDRRRERNRLAFALHLCALRYPGRMLRAEEVIPPASLRFVAEQLGAEPEAMTATAFHLGRKPLAALREAFGFVDLTMPHRREMLERLSPVALATTSAATIAARARLRRAVGTATTGTYAGRPTGTPPAGDGRRRREHRVSEPVDPPHVR